MLTIETLEIPDYEKVIVAKDPSVMLHCIIVVHSTKLGPSLGGVRIFPYSSENDALEDALRLAKAMTYKTALCKIGIGGGKSVIIADPKTGKTPSLLQAFGKVVDLLKGSYIVAEDVGSTPQDLLFIRESTPYVAALPTNYSSGDPSRFTAWGVVRGLQAVAMTLWGSTSLKGRSIAIQGLGHVGSNLAEMLFWQGADLILCDLDAERTTRFCHEYSAKQVSPAEYAAVECDILAPCALGGIINPQTIPKLRCLAVAGAANNQLSTPDDAIQLHKRGILYAPDYAINAGGVINATAEFEKTGYKAIEARDQTHLIFETLLQIFAKSKAEDRATSIIADKLAEHNIAAGIGKRSLPIF
ncbi:MAG: Glu/Leu/Phe/Val dehydrogenase dimerization domain-containing protein [Parachlamydiales bacterium]